jgi:hypothetical protein
MVALEGAVAQDPLLAVTVRSAERSAEVAQLRFNEGFAGYERVLDAQQALFAQQNRYVTNHSKIVSSFISLYLALGGGWQLDGAGDIVDDATEKVMTGRTDWGELIPETEGEVRQLNEAAARP